MFYYTKLSQKKKKPRSEANCIKNSSQNLKYKLEPDIENNVNKNKEPKRAAELNFNLEDNCKLWGI